MKSIGIDFSNRMLCIMTEGQQGTERAIEELSDISKFYCFIPEKYRNHTSYTWNFEDETFSVEQTIYQYGETRSLGDQWRNRFCRSYKNHYGKEIDFPQWREIKDKYILGTDSQRILAYAEALKNNKK